MYFWLTQVNRPDDGPETLGLHIIDEPAAQQSDPTVLGIQLRSISKQTTTKQVAVKSIPDPDANPKVKHYDTFFISTTSISTTSLRFGYKLISISSFFPLNY